MIPVPKNFLAGEGLLEAGYPWLVPAAVDWLDGYLTKDMSVLEFGSGGSTVFFAERCKYVTSCESLYPWLEKTKAELLKRKLTNVRLCSCIEPPEDIHDRIYQVALIDSTHLKREYATEAALRSLRRGSILILDNYYCQYCELVRSMLTIYHYIDYNMPLFAGDGTRIYRI